jgi:hemerythrin-like domain-containing protein
VETHIRFEERELFPHLEKVFNGQELEDIGAALEQSNATPFEEKYPDEFWVNQHMEKKAANK